VHVNDTLIIGLPEAIKTFKQALRQEFKIKDLGPAKDYLRIEIEQSYRGSDIRIYQNRYLKQVLSRFDAVNFNFTKSPLPPNVEIDLSDTKFLTNA
jgi:Reverse transcriptase (RNA-dependent DNA polymerase)